jgi:O-antigen chain-terminating methyltransferase
MIETRNQEIDINELKARIRLAVERREAEGRLSFARASAELFDLLAREDFSIDRLLDDSLALPSPSPSVSDLVLQPEFVAREAGYHVNDLLKYHDHQFVWNAYLALLKREPDEEGLQRHLRELRGGRVNKIDILARLRYSPEGKRQRVTIDGLRLPAMIRRFYRLPGIGYLLELTMTIARLPSWLHHQRQIEGYFVAQQERLADHLNQMSRALPAEAKTRADFVESVKRAISEVAKEQKLLAGAQHAQLTAVLQRQQGFARGHAGENGRSSLASATQIELDKLYASFQHQFRGACSDAKEELKSYLSLLKEAEIDSGILDLGCGRGDWLDLLREHGIDARGVESNRILIAEARKRNLTVVAADAIRHLRALPENSLNAITAFHFVEHLTFEELIDSLSEIRRTLKPSGLLVIETPNPKNLVVGACNFYSDPTHNRPLFPESLHFILDHLSFEEIRIQYLHPVPDSPFVEGDAAARALDAWFFSARDYAVIAHKRGVET